MIYLDNSATTKPCEAALNAYRDYAENFGNASSQYEIGIRNAKLIEEAREKIAKCINAYPEEILFTSGGTESDNWALHNAFDMHWLISDIEHPAIHNGAIHNLNYRHSVIPVNKDGIVDVEYLRNILALANEPQCISVMLANNETGMIQPIKEIVEVCDESGQDYIVHTDAVQAMGHMHIDVKELGVDMLSASGHKFGAFPGVGFLYIRSRDLLAIPFIAGGHQEGGLRGGTYNVPGIVGMADALIESQIKMSTSKCDELRRLCISLLNESIEKVTYNTLLDKSLPHILNFTVHGVRAEELVSYLDANKIFISSGSACTSGDQKPSHVLLAMGRTEEEAESSIRISMSHETTKSDIRTFVSVLAEGVKLLRKE